MPTLPKNRYIPAIAFLALAFIIFLRSATFRPPKHLDVAALQIQTLANHPIDTQNKAVILNFWAPWCGPCLLEMPALQRLQTAHPQDLAVIGIEDDPDAYVDAALFIQSHAITFPIAARNASITTAIGATQTLPTTLYIARSGAVVHTVTGTIPEARMITYAADAMR